MKKARMKGKKDGEDMKREREKGPVRPVEKRGGEGMQRSARTDIKTEMGPARASERARSKCRERERKRAT